MKPSRKRKRISTDMSKNESTPKRVKTEMSYITNESKVRLATENSSTIIASVREIKIILDKSIVDKYFHAKQMLREILSPTDPRKNLRPKKVEKSKKQTSLLDYLQVKNHSLDCSSSSCNIENSRNIVIKKEQQELTADVDQNTDVTFDVNSPRIVCYAGSDQSNCFFYNDSSVVMPINAQFTPEEFVYNNCGFVSVMGVPIKTEPPEEESIVIEELDVRNSVYEHTLSDVMSIDEITTTSTPMIKCTFDKQKIKSEAKQPKIKFDKHGFPLCPKCDRRFRILESFKQHILLCGLEFPYECSYCTYNTKFIYAMKKHVERNHKKEAEEECLKEIMKKIRNKRTDNKNLSLMSKEAEHDLEAEDSAVIKSIENIISKHSKLKFDVSCPKCEKSFKRVRGIPIKTCPDCEVTLKFKCQKCERIFSQYDKIYRHNISCVNVHDELKVREKIFLNCEHCVFKTYYKAALRQHMYQHMNNDKSMYFKCKMCPYESLYEPNYKRHKRAVHGSP